MISEYAFYSNNDSIFSAKQSQDDNTGGGLLSRDEIPEADTWDLIWLYPTDDAWEKDFAAWEKRIPEYDFFKGKLSQPDQLLAFLKFDLDFSRWGEKIGSYSMLKSSQDVANSKYQAMVARVQTASVKAGQASSYMRPELLGMPEADWQRLVGNAIFEPYRLNLERIARDRPHTLSEKEERLLAMLGDFSSGPSQIFGQLNNADLRFGFVRDENGKSVELTNGSFTVFLNNPNREIRKKAFFQFYQSYDEHENTLAATLNASIQKDNYYAQARNFENPLDAALFHEEVPRIVYDNLIAGVHEALPALYRYFNLRRRKMGLDDIHFYDTYLPILSDIKSSHTWEQAVDLVIESLRPLGAEYCNTLHDGLLKNRWADRYENRGKRSGAFSAGSFDGLPYILMNYKPDIIEHVYTLAHEAGHSMHTWYSARNQPYQYYDYVLFVAEVASTFNEQL
ncbi:MAG: oligoendopeptidase F family protein, partial [Planctomycetaceae bacterium]|nr:oligoendopeptidase F family protein [Planctomycetaceae bacterium]